MISVSLGWPEDRSTLHWLENRGAETAVEVSVDIVATSPVATNTPGGLSEPECGPG